jgi:hypothetical protein
LPTAAILVIVPVSVEVVFNPNWWFRNYGISFDQPFYFDRKARIKNDLAMRRALYERFGIGEPNPDPRPVVGSQHVAGGFVVPALLGVEIRFSEHDAPWPVPADLSREQALALRVPDIERTWPMDRLIADMDWLQKEFGHVVGDFNIDGLLTTALHLRGQQFFLDLVEDPELAGHLLSVISETQARVASYVRSRTGTASVAVNRSILHVDPTIFVHGNCTVQMISPALYRKTLLPHECRLAEQLRPYGIHHCGGNLHLFAEAYAETGAVFYDVGWGSDVAACSRALPDAFLNLRLSPVRMLQSTAGEIRTDTEQLLAAAGRTERVGVCSINMDHGTPDGNVLAMIDAARSLASAD